MQRIRAFALVLTAAMAVATWPGVADARVADDREAVSAHRGVALTSGACSRNTGAPFAPTRISLGGVGGAKILGTPRVKGIPGTPPLSEAGKAQMAWDKPGLRPGFAHGHVLMNAHAWPDGTALGNHLVAGLKVGALIKVSGRGDRLQCYRVVSLTVKAPSKALTRLYYGSDKSAPRLALLTCAGVRRGPGDWSKRAVWLAKPVR